MKSRAAYIYPVLGATRAPSSGAPVRQTTATTASTYPSSASRSVGEAMARKKIREYDSKRLLKEHLKRLAGIDLQILSAQVMAPSLSPPPVRARALLPHL